MGSIFKGLNVGGMSLKLTSLVGSSTAKRRLRVGITKVGPANTLQCSFRMGVSQYNIRKCTNGQLLCPSTVSVSERSHKYISPFTVAPHSSRGTLRWRREGGILQFPLRKAQCEDSSFPFVTLL